MATEQRGLCIGFLTASADNSTKQHRFVKVSGDLTITVCAASTDKPIGILQNKPASGAAADVMITGVSKVILAATLSAGAEVMSDANGAAVAAATATNRSLGILLKGGVSGDVVEVLLGAQSRLIP
jgi:hypothetical protein